MEKAVFPPDLGPLLGRPATDIKGVPQRERVAREALACAFLRNGLRSKGEPSHEVPGV